MKRLNIPLLVSIALLFLVSTSHARLVTMMTQGTSESTTGTNEVFIEAYEVAEIVSFPTAMNINSSLEVLKDGRKAILQTLFVGGVFFEPVIVAGPATIRLVVSGNPTRAGLCTIKITPEAYPPDRAILMPPGTNQARINLECSTNLVQWFTATNGVYGPLPEAKFFRIKLEPVP